MSFAPLTCLFPGTAGTRRRGRERPDRRDRRLRSAQGAGDRHRPRARVAWNDTAKQVALPGVGMYPIGVAVLAAGNGPTSVRVRLDVVATA